MLQLLFSIVECGQTIRQRAFVQLVVPVAGERRHVVQIV